jgi:hypothetical protein
MEESFADRRRALKAWLDANVLVPPRPSEISISDLKFDWENGQGSFLLSLDSQELEDRFDLWIAIDGKVNFGVPMFVSPMGAPASFAAVDLDQDTQSAIQRALDRVFPEFFSYGRHKGRRRYIDAYTPLMRRIKDQAQFEVKKRALEGQSLVIKEPVMSGNMIVIRGEEK